MCTDLFFAGVTPQKSIRKAHCVKQIDKLQTLQLNSSPDSVEGTFVDFQWKITYHLKSVQTETCVQDVTFTSL